MLFVVSITVTDPGFSVGGAPTRWGGADLQHVHFLAKMYAKMKQLDPVGGGHVPAAPPGSATALCFILIVCRIDRPCGRGHEIVHIPDHIWDQKVYF